MHLTGQDWGLLLATQRLVDYLTEIPPSAHPQVRCARLILYRSFAKAALSMNQEIDGLPITTSKFSPKQADQLEFRDVIVASVIENMDPELRGVLKAASLESELKTIALVYARIVVGSENDPNCERILTELRQGGLNVPQSGTCT